MRAILLATRNAGKARELRELTRGRLYEWVGLDRFPEVAEPEESGRTLFENARLKALYYSRETGLPALADDSGLEVDALGGAPGVDSAYLAGHPRDDAANNRKLVEVMREVSADARTARYRCVTTLVIDGRVTLETTGTVEGVIQLEPRGSNGFGYDPHFFIPSKRCTMAELSPEEKNAISHRGIALKAMLARISEYLPPL